MERREWREDVIDSQSSDAVRIPNGAPVVESVRAIGDVVYEARYRMPEKWREGVVPRYIDDGPECILLHLVHLCQRYSSSETDKQGQEMSSVQRRCP
jgi:hypothetical protein